MNITSDKPATNKTTSVIDSSSEEKDLVALSANLDAEKAKQLEAEKLQLANLPPRLTIRPVQRTPIPLPFTPIPVLRPQPLFV